MFPMATRVQSHWGGQGQFAMLDAGDHTDSECEQEANASVDTSEEIKGLQAQAQAQVPAHVNNTMAKKRSKTKRTDLCMRPDTISDDEFDRILNETKAVSGQERADAGNYTDEKTMQSQSPLAADLVPQSAVGACHGAPAAFATFLAMASAATGLSAPACVDAEARPRRREQAKTKAAFQKPQRTCRAPPAVAMKTNRLRGR